MAKYKMTFQGRARGELERCRFTETVEAPDADEALIKLYDTHEHIELLNAQEVEGPRYVSYRVRVRDKHGVLVTELWLPTRERALAAARAIAAPGSLKAEPDDTVTVEEHIVTELAAFTKEGGH